MTKLKLPPMLTIQHAAEFGQQLKTLKIRGDLSIQATDVQRVDTTGVQLLLGIVEQQVRKGKDVIWQDSSESLNSVAEQLGVKTQLKL